MTPNHPPYPFFPKSKCVPPRGGTRFPPKSGGGRRPPPLPLEKTLVLGHAFFFFFFSWYVAIFLAKRQRFFCGGVGGGSTPLGGFFRRVQGGWRKKKSGGRKISRGGGRHAPTCALAMGPYSASCLVNKVTPCSQNATQLVKRRRKRKHAAWQKTKSSVPCACGASLQPTLPMT